jgi:hypothetical protein
MYSNADWLWERLQWDYGDNGMKLFYISFATDVEFLGATVIDGLSETSALDIATNLGLNPGGQAVVLELPPDLWEAPDVKPMIGKLFNKEQMRAMGSKSHKDLDEETKELLECSSYVVDQ